ncbi:MAG: phosphoenolpyruvate--protein phosphotransferase, partial [Proteobacteria bacterium]
FYATPAPRGPAGLTEQTVELAATIQLPGEVEEIFHYGASSVGLCRTEFLFLEHRTPPDEEEQYAMYAKLVHAMRGRSIALRTFDLGGDKPSSFVDLPHEQNPALGLRAIRIGLRDPARLGTQVRAILRASRLGDVKLLLPMVSTLAEVQAVKHLVAAASREIGLEAKVPIGIMIEVPAVAVLADLFAKEVDFFSIGTNDLVQYTLAVDRTSQPLAELSSPLDPAVLRLIALSSHAAKLHDIPLSVCGAAVADPLAAIVFAGLGATGLSMNARALPLVREALRRVGKASAIRVADHALGLRTAAEVESYLAHELEPRLGELLHERA